MTQNILPEDSKEAVEKMIEIIRDMKKVAETEAKALERRDPVELNELIAVKDKTSRTFEQAGKEFHQRREEFTGVEPTLLLQLAKEQSELQRLTATNSAYYRAAAKKKG